MRSTAAVLLNEFFNVVVAKACDLTKTDARNSWLLAGDVVVYPGLAYAQPYGHVRNCEKAFWFAESVPIRLGGASDGSRPPEIGLREMRQ